MALTDEEKHIARLKYLGKENLALLKYGYKNYNVFRKELSKSNKSKEYSEYSDTFKQKFELTTPKCPQCNVGEEYLKFSLIWGGKRAMGEKEYVGVVFCIECGHILGTAGLGSAFG